MTGPAGIGNERPRHVRALDDDVDGRLTITSSRSVAAIGRLATMRIGIERGDDRGRREKPDVNRERLRLEDEEVQFGGNARHALEDAIEPDANSSAERQRQQPADADDQRRLPQHVRPRARARSRARASAAISPRRWFTDTVSSTVMSSTANETVTVVSTVEI